MAYAPDYDRYTIQSTDLLPEYKRLKDTEFRVIKKQFVQVKDQNFNDNNSL